ncbi:MAG TPA: type II toxin-antitoxin system HicB family antitoxin [Spirochaetes bacterium]|nr:type II toxin-antitoxin system HicB family antitoxin [Spirochaetota bacterium]
METLLQVDIEELENGEYLVTSHDLADLIAQGRTVAEALEIAADLARKLYESYKDRELPVPPIFTQSKPLKKASIPVNIP